MVTIYHNPACGTSRNTLALIREAGFPPLNIAPVDFVALYRQQLEANGGQAPGITTGPVGHA